MPTRMGSEAIEIGGCRNAMCAKSSLAKGRCDVCGTKGTVGMNTEEVTRMRDGMSSLHDIGCIGDGTKTVRTRRTGKRYKIDCFTIFRVLLLPPTDTDQCGFGISRRR